MIEKYISELLYSHDCVIVPNLGGFLASNQNASVSASTQTIFPPFRKLAFNIYLRRNDGLLANHLVSFENMTYSEAMNEIEKFVSLCLETIDSGRKMALANIGTLCYDGERNIQFEANRQANHLLDSFGMQPVHFSPRVKLPESEKRSIASRPSIPLKKRKITSVKTRNILGAIGLTAAIAWFSFNLYLVTPKNYQSTSLSPFDSQAIIPNKDTFNKSVQLTPPAVTPAQVETVYVAAVVPEKTEEKPEAIKPVVVPESRPEIVLTSFHHHVVSGVFKIRENAESQVQMLRAKGFSTATIIEANGRNYVTFGSFSSQSAAMSMADTLGKDSAWVWKN